MAKIFPESCPDDATPGEKALFKIFKDKLPDDFLVWYNPVIDITNKPDFIIYGPNFGVLVLEVKDWSVEIIVEADSNIFVIDKRKNGSTENYKAPLKQCSIYMFSLIDCLKKEAKLVNNEGEHQGKLGGDTEVVVSTIVTV